MAEYDIRIYGAEIGVGGSADPLIYQKSMFKLIHSEFVQDFSVDEEINTFNFSQDDICEDVVSQGEIEPL